MDNELYHYGVLGMRWGVRRYQNKDGSLTKAGQKRYNKEMAKVREKNKALNNSIKTKAKLENLENKKKALKEKEQLLKGKNVADRDKKVETSTKSKKISDMSDDDLRAMKSRIQLEKDTLDLKYQLTSIESQKVSIGKKIADAVINDVVIPAVKESGKELLKKVIMKEGAKALKLGNDQNGKKNNK